MLVRSMEAAVVSSCSLHVLELRRKWQTLCEGLKCGGVADCVRDSGVEGRQTLCEGLKCGGAVDSV